MEEQTETELFAVKFKTLCGEKHWIPFDLCKKIEKQRNDAIKTIERQAERIRYLEGATNHATGTPLSTAIKERDNALSQLTGLENEKNEIKKSSR